MRRSLPANAVSFDGLIGGPSLVAYRCGGFFGHALWQSGHESDTVGDAPTWQMT